MSRKMSRVKIHGSFAAIPRWMVNSDISDRAFRVWSVLYIEGIDNDSDLPTMSHEEIARNSRCSVSSVRRALEELENLEALRVMNVTSWRGKEANQYHLTMQQGVWDELDDSDCSPVDDPVRSPMTDPSLKEVKKNPRVRSVDPIFEAFCKEEGIDWKNSNSKELGAINGACGVARKMDPPPSSEDIHARAARYREIWPTAIFTAQGLMKHWSKMAPVASVAPPQRSFLDEGLAIVAYTTYASNPEGKWLDPRRGPNELPVELSGDPRNFGISDPRERSTDV